MDVLVLHRANAQGVHKRVADVGGIEHNFATDIRQAKAIAVTAHTSDDARQHTTRIRCMQRTETQWVHNSYRPRTHRNDVAHDAAHTGCRTLVRLDI